MKNIIGILFLVPMITAANAAQFRVLAECRGVYSGTHRKVTIQIFEDSFGLAMRSKGIPELQGAVLEVSTLESPNFKTKNQDAVGEIRADSDSPRGFWQPIAFSYSARGTDEAAAFLSIRELKKNKDGPAQIVDHFDMSCSFVD